MQGAIRDFKWGQISDYQENSSTPQGGLHPSRRLKGVREVRLAYPESAFLASRRRRELCSCVCCCDSWALPLKLAYVKALARHTQDPEKRRQPDNHWMARFLDRHPILASKIANCINRQRAQADDQALV